MNYKSLFLLLFVACSSSPKPPDMKARLKELVEPKLKLESELQQQALSQSPLKDELAFLAAEIKKVESAPNCAKENASLEPKELEEKCKLNYYADLKSRYSLLLSTSEHIKERLSIASNAAPKTNTAKASTCQDCHLLIDAPGFARIEGAEVFASHPKLEALLGTHDPNTFGCEQCHLGNEAFQTGAAHNQMLWEPNSPTNEAHVWQSKVNPGAKPSDWIQSSCTNCHADDMSFFASVECSSDSDCGEGYVCGTFAQRAARALEKVPYTAATAQSKGEDPEKAVEPIMATLLANPRSYNKLEEAKYAGLDAAVQAMKDSKPLFEAVELGRLAIQEMIALPVLSEDSTVKAAREDLLGQKQKKLSETIGKGSDLFATLSYGEPNKLLCVEEKSNIARVDIAPIFTKGKMLLREAGCYGCHDIPGAEQLPKPGPALDRLAFKTNVSWLASWISNPKDFRPNTRMPNFFPEAIEPRSLREIQGKDGHALGRYYGFDGKVKGPKRDAANYEASIYQLHSDSLSRRDDESKAMAAYLVSASKSDKTFTEVSGDADKGKTLFEIRGCLGCHQAQARPAFDPSQEVPEAGESCDVRLGQDCNPTKPYQNAYSHFDIAPNLSNIGDKTNSAWLFAWLKDPKSLQPDSRMPSLRLSDEDAKDLAAYLMTLTTKSPQVTPEEKATPELINQGKGLIESYGCFQCHVIPGFEERAKVGPSLFGFGNKTELSYGDVFTTENEKTWENWTEQKLLHPRSLDTKATMPYSQLRPDEVYALLITLKGMRQKVTANNLPGSTTPKEVRQQGRLLVARYNCWGCHTLDGKESVILPYFETLDSLGENQEIRRTFGPPSLLGEGDRVRSLWMTDFLQNVVPLRPWLEGSITVEEASEASSQPARTAGIRMPSFEMPVKDAELLANYFASMSGKPFPEQAVEANELTYEEALVGRSLFIAAKCASCHPYEGKAQAPSLSLAKKRLQGDWMLRWLISPERTLPGTTRMPPFFGDPDDVLRGRISTLLADFLNGDPAAQIVRLRDYVMILSECPPDESLPCRVGTGATLPASVPASVPVP